MIAEQASATTNRRLRPGCATPASPTGARSRTSTSTSSPPSTANSSPTSPPCASSPRTGRSAVGPTRLRQDPPRRGARHPGRRGRLPRLLHHRRRHGATPWPGPGWKGPGPPSCGPTPPPPSSSSTTSGSSPWPVRLPPRSSTSSTPATTSRPPTLGHHQPGLARMGRALRRCRRRRRHPRPAHAQRHRVQHPRSVVAHPRARGARRGGAHCRQATGPDGQRGWSLGSAPRSASDPRSRTFADRGSRLRVITDRDFQ